MFSEIISVSLTNGSSVSGLKNLILVLRLHGRFVDRAIYVHFM